jgi:hypothetical protein
VRIATRGIAALLPLAASVSLSALPYQPEVAYRGSVDLMASEALIMTGTGMPEVSTAWISHVTEEFIKPTIGGSFSGVPLKTPEQFWPFTGLTSLTLEASIRIGWEILDSSLKALIAQNAQNGAPLDPLAVFGYSQSSIIASVGKQFLTLLADSGAWLPSISFVLMGNPIRPNGGLFSRQDNLGLVSWASINSTPTNTPFPTVDIARQYDFFADFPTDSGNLLAVANALLGGAANHDYGPVSLDPSSANYDPNTVVQRYGDTTYYLIPAKQLPLLTPLRAAGMDVLADIIEPTLRVLVELGYDRTAPYGEYVPAQSLPVTDTAALSRDLDVAFKQGLAVVESEFSRSVATAPVAATVPEKTEAIARESLRSGQRSDSPKTRAASRVLTGSRRGAATDVPNPKQRRPSQAG